MTIPPRQSRTVRATRSIAGLAPPPPGAATPGTPVNPASRAVNPKEQYPLHYDLLMRDLYALGLVPEEWKVVAADEVRLDEAGMDVEFTLVEPKQNLVRRRRVDVQHGKLVAVRDC